LINQENIQADKSTLKIIFTRAATNQLSEQIYHFASKISENVKRQ